MVARVTIDGEGINSLFETGSAYAHCCAAVAQPGRAAGC